MSSTDRVDNQLLFLPGQVPVHEFVSFVKTRAIDGYKYDDLALTREWQDVRNILRELEPKEARASSFSDPAPLPTHVTALADKELADVLRHSTMSCLPCRWAMVELDSLIVCQKGVDIGFATSLAQTLPPHPTVEDLISFAVGKDRTQPDLQVEALSSSSFAFSSQSSDMRVLGAIPLQPSDVKGYEPYGTAAAVLAVFIGYSSNAMWALQADKKLVLLNGTHRSYALRARGITHAPCIVSRLSHRDDLDLVSARDQKDKINSYLSSARPPLLKDCFDSRLHKLIPVHKAQHSIQLNLEFERKKYSLPMRTDPQ